MLFSSLGVGASFAASCTHRLGTRALEPWHICCPESAGPPWPHVAVLLLLMLGVRSHCLLAVLALALAAGPKSAGELAKELGALPPPPAVHSPNPCAACACRTDNPNSIRRSQLSRCEQKGLLSMKQGHTAVLASQGFRMRVTFKTQDNKSENLPGLHPDMLARVLRAAVVMRLLGVDRGAPPRFRNTALSATLLDSNPHSVWPMVRGPPLHVCSLCNHSIHDLYAGSELGSADVLEGLKTCSVFGACLPCILHQIARKSA